MSRPKLAEASGVLTRTLIRWEQDEHLPGQAEWRSVMQALRATTSERTEAAVLLNNRRGLRLARQEAQSPDETKVEHVGPLPGTGDLLRSLRLRRRWTQSQTAEKLCVSRATVNRWETMHSLPGDENLERLCAVLGARPEERQALLQRRLEPPEWKPLLTWDECVTQFATSQFYTSPLGELNLLGLKRQVHLQMHRTSDAYRLMARLEGEYAALLYLLEREGECRQHLERSLTMIGDRFPHDPLHFGLLNLAAGIANGTPGGGPRLYQRWLPRLPLAVYRIGPFCDMALYASSEPSNRSNHSWDATETLLAEARRLIESDSKATTDHRNYYDTIYASILRLQGRPWEAMQRLPPLGSLDTAPVLNIILWAQIFLEAGDLQTATRHLNHAATRLAALPHPRMQKEWESVVGQLEATSQHSYRYALRRS